MAPRTYYEEPSGNVYTGRPADMMSLYTGNLKNQGETTINYRLRLWVDENYNPQNDNGGLIYKVKVNVYGQTSDTVAQAEDTYCKDKGFTTLSDCMLVMNNHEATTDAARTAIKAKGTPDFTKIAPNDTETDGLYMTEDDDGESYYYRGAVKNNYVSFAGYTFDESTKKFALTGDIQQLTWKDNRDEIVNNRLYSCLETSCNVVYKVTGYSNATTMIVRPISYSSNSLLSAQTNNTDSTIKIKLDSWYKTNLVNYSSYLADETFCSDRSIISGTGYSVDSYTFYGTLDRLQNRKSPSLKCSQENDRFKVSSTSAKLDYPIGLILADEVVLAGGRGLYNGMYSPNSNYYLYNGKYFWIFSPSYFEITLSYVAICAITETGSLNNSTRVINNFGVRPVINLKSDVTISKGDGSSINPFAIN